MYCRILIFSQSSIIFHTINYTLNILAYVSVLVLHFHCVFFFSTIKDPEVHPQPESYWGNVNPVGPRACYDESKRLGETMTYAYFRHVSLIFICNSVQPNMMNISNSSLYMEQL